MVKEEQTKPKAARSRKIIQIKMEQKNNRENQLNQQKAYF